MLRPSKFQSNAADAEKAATNNVFKLKPSVLDSSSHSQGSDVSSDSQTFQNPFLAHNNSVDESTTAVAAAATAEAATTAEEEKKMDENSDPLSQLSRTASLPKSNLFSVKGSFSEASGFVFGQNISERVTGAVEVTEKNGEAAAATDSSLLFSSRLNNSGSSESGAMEKKEVDGQSLLEATRKYEENNKVQKRKYEEVETVTGEEDERNVMELNCKIFAFVASNYEERGRGTLRLNDSKANSNESRVVFRTSGNFFVLINTKVWPGMVVELPSTKSLRMTAIDSEGHIKVFLVMARPDDVTQLYKLLNDRVTRQKQLCDEEEATALTLDNCPVAPVEIRIEEASDEGTKDAETGEPQPKKAIWTKTTNSH